jgi:hypothetical protein
MNVAQLAYLSHNDFGTELFIASLNYVLYYDAFTWAIDTTLLLTIWLIVRSKLWSFRRYPRSVYTIRRKNIDFPLIHKMETERSMQQSQSRIEHLEAMLEKHRQPINGLSFQFKSIVLVLFHCRMDIYSCWQYLYSTIHHLCNTWFQS